jgi:myo-inositol-1-phosphate synthase
MDPKGTQSSGKLAILTPGLGAVSTTFMAGVLAVRKGIADPVGSYTQMGSISAGAKKTPVRGFVPLADLHDIVFGAWDLFTDNAYESALHAGVLDPALLEELKPELSAIKPMKAVFYEEYVKRLQGGNVKREPTKMRMAEALMEDISSFMRTNGCERAVMVWCASTETYLETGRVHSTIPRFEEALRNNDPSITPCMIYAYASIKSGIPFANGAPHWGCDIPALRKLAEQEGVPVAGKDFKTGQTLMKTTLAPGLRARMLGVKSWFSTNILGNRDGEVLDEPGNLRSKELTKLGVLEGILDPSDSPELYGDLYHKVSINYFPPRGDNKESWDSIDLFGWLGYPMQIKINFQCRDSILAAPVVLDVALFLDLAHRAGLHGAQEWLSIYFKSPQTRGRRRPTHDLFAQLARLEDTLRRIRVSGSE